METPAAWCVPPLADPDDRARIILGHVYDALGDPVVRTVALACLGCRPKTLSEYGRAAAVLRRAQAIGYKDDPFDCDRYAPVAYTLAHGGDCDDLTPAVMAIAILCGFEAMLVYLPQPGARQDHVTAKIKVDGEWLWAEPALPGAHLGEHPYEAARRLGGMRHVTGSVAGVIDGIAANLLTVGIIGVAAYVAARALSSRPRSNPVPRDVQHARDAVRRLRVRLPPGVSYADLAYGMRVEGEHRDVTRGRAGPTARIALAHLRERADYYDRLDEAEQTLHANPFAGFRDFAACERAARRRGVDDPGAYCGAVKRRVERVPRVT